MKLELVMLTTVISLFGGVNANNQRKSASISIPGTIDGSSPRLFLVTCTNDCKVVSAKSFGGTAGPLQIQILKHKTYDSVCIESDFSGSPECKRADGGYWSIGKKYFYIHLASFNGGIGNGVSVSVTLEGSVPTLVEVIATTAAVQKDKSGKAYVEVKLGSPPIKGVNFRHFKVECSDNCKGIGFSSSGGTGDVKLFGREAEPAFIHQNACINNCICESNDPGNADVCKLPDGTRKFDLSSKIFWIHLDPNPSIVGLTAKVTGDNIVKVSKIEDITEKAEELSDGSFVIALSPTKKGEYKHLAAYGRKKMKNFRLQLFGAGQSDIEVRAGPTTKVDANGVCEQCDCQGVKCNSAFDTTDTRLYITFEMLKDVNGIVYVKLFGNDIWAIYRYNSAYGSYV